MTDGGSAVAFELNALNLVDISNNLGDSKASSPTPATKAHSKLSQANHDHLAISDGLVRLHVGP
jgi:cystathionine beta-lyase/cystathionine gamma-synthase